MRGRRQRVAVIMVLSFGTFGAIAACGPSGRDVASIQTEPGAEMGSPNAAEQFASCLKDLGVGTRIEVENDASRVVVESAELWSMCLKDSYCSGGGGTSLGEAEMAAANEVMSAALEKYVPDQSEGFYHKPHLIVGTEDLTDGFLTCVAKTGYEDPPDIVDPTVERAQKEAMVREANAWIACARGAGMTELKDLGTPVLDGNETYPTAVIPLTVEDELLRAVIKACPPSDSSSRADMSLEPWTDPMIGLDAPGYDGFAIKPGKVMPSTDPKTKERVKVLLSILDPGLTEE